MRVWVVAACVCACAMARADETEPPVGWSVGTGVALAMIPLAVGGGITASYDDEGPRRAGMHLLCVGWAVAPFVSHAIAREWKRALVFSAVPVAAAVLAISLLEGSRPDDLLGGGTPPPRVAYGAALAVEAVATGVGLIDSLMAGERWKKRHRVTVMPQLGPGRIGLNLGGPL